MKNSMMTDRYLISVTTHTLAFMHADSRSHEFSYYENEFIVIFNLLSASLSSMFSHKTYIIATKVEYCLYNYIHDLF